MRTPNFSSAATTTSTIDSESTSRSSRKVFSGETAVVSTPATSLRISARPFWISSLLIDVPPAFCAVCCSGGYVRGMLCGCRGKKCGGFAVQGFRASGNPNHLAGIGQAGAEGEEQDRVSRGDVAALDHPGEGLRDAGR